MSTTQAKVTGLPPPPRHDPNPVCDSLSAAAQLLSETQDNLTTTSSDHRFRPGTTRGEAITTTALRREHQISLYDGAPNLTHGSGSDMCGHGVAEGFVGLGLGWVAAIDSACAPTDLDPGRSNYSRKKLHPG